MPRALPYMPFYVGDYLADTGHLSTQEHGAYLLILFHYWQREGLPANEDQIRRIAKLDRKSWNQVRQNIAEFFDLSESRWIHNRVEADLERSRVKCDKARAAGIKSGEARSNKRSTDVEQTLNERSSGVRTEREHSHNPKPNTEKNIEPVLSPIHCPTAPPSDVKVRKAGRVDQELRDAFDQFWPLYPRKVGKTRALEVWLREIRIEVVPDVIQAALRYVELRHGEDEQFTLHASTWLRNGRWRDSLTDEKPKPPTGNGNGKLTVSERNRKSRDEFLAAFGLSAPGPDSGAGQRSRQLRGVDDPAGSG